MFLFAADSLIINYIFHGASIEMGQSHNFFCEIESTLKDLGESMDFHDIDKMVMRVY